MLMQSYDFLMLNRKYNCKIELGGDDQWSNILGGIDLCRRKDQKQVYGMTFTLLTNSEGKKMGKTQSGAVWLDPKKTTPYDFYQYWVNVQDADVIKCLKLLTFVPMDEIRKMEKWEGKELNEAKRILAYEVTKLVHGEEEAEKAKKTAEEVFAKGGVKCRYDRQALYLTLSEWVYLICLLRQDLLTVEGGGKTSCYNKTVFQSMM